MVVAVLTASLEPCVSLQARVEGLLFHPTADNVSDSRGTQSVEESCLMLFLSPTFSVDSGTYVSLLPLSFVPSLIH